jgi:hypothetical protein
VNEDERVREDLRALGSASEHGLPDMERTVQMARRRAVRAPAARREWLMLGLHAVQRRPWLASALGVVAIAVVLSVVPVSYERTAGHEVDLSLAAGNLAPAQILPIARELKSALRAAHVVVREQNGSTVLSAFVPASAGNGAAAGQAFARQLSAKGYAATASVRTVKERVSGSVYAFARDQVITVATDGKSAAQLESEIRQRLADAGVPDAVVSVTDEGPGKRKVKVEVNREGVTPETPDETGAPKLVLTKDGTALPAEGLEVRVMKKQSPAGLTLVVEARDGGRLATATVPNAGALDDASLAREIERQLAAAGIPVKVTASGGRIEVEKQ